MPPSSLPTGPYGIQNTDDRARLTEVTGGVLPIELRALWVPNDADHQLLNDLLLHVSVLELDHLAQAAADGNPYTVDPLDDLLPRPGWEIVTRLPDQPSRYTLRQLDTDAYHEGPRRELLLLLELEARALLAPHEGRPPPQEWIRRLREVYPRILAALEGEALFEPAEVR
jgi:hypothetical protein